MQRCIRLPWQSRYVLDSSHERFLRAANAFLVFSLLSVGDFMVSLPEELIHSTALDILSRLYLYGKIHESS